MPSKWTGQKKKQYNCNLKSLQQRVQHLSLLVQDEQQRVAATHDAQLVGAVSKASTYCRVRCFQIVLRPSLLLIAASVAVCVQQQIRRRMGFLCALLNCSYWQRRSYNTG